MCSLYRFWVYDFLYFAKPYWNVSGVPRRPERLPGKTEPEPESFCLGGWPRLAHNCMCQWLWGAGGLGRQTNIDHVLTILKGVISAPSSTPFPTHICCLPCPPTCHSLQLPGSYLIPQHNFLHHHSVHHHQHYNHHHRMAKIKINHHCHHHHNAISKAADFSIIPWSGFSNFNSRDEK